MVNLNDIRNTLVSELGKGKDLPCHVSAFCAWIVSDHDTLRRRVAEALGFAAEIFHPEYVAALGYAAASALLTPEEYDLLHEKILHLSGRGFFAPKRPLVFEVDGIALLGVSLGIANDKKVCDRRWWRELLAQSEMHLSSDTWQTGLVRAARLVVGETNLRVVPPDLAIAMNAKGIGVCDRDDLTSGWEMTTQLKAHDGDPGRDAVRLALFNHLLARQGQIAIAAANRNDLISLLTNLIRSMRLWTYEHKSRTPNSSIARWEIENEYHVQNLLWTVLAPVFADLENEENLPSIGHKHPRVDLGIPSLRTIVEVKFMRGSGQAACAKIIEEVAADASLYLSKTDMYDNIVALVWDDVAQTEQHQELKSGLESIKGVSAAIVLPRPLKMKRS
jgi:hypothetical protein